MKHFKTEFYPDGFTEKGLANGRKAFTLSIYKNNPTRFNEMTADERVAAIVVIEEFEKKLLMLKKQIIENQQ